MHRNHDAFRLINKKLTPEQKSFQKCFVPKSILIIGGVILINNSANSKQEKNNFNSAHF